MNERSFKITEFAGPVKKIWDASPHCAFTDLIHFQDGWYCAFREADTHVKGRDGEIRVLRSLDGDAWSSTALISEAGQDLRDPQFSVMPDGRLMLLFGAVSHTAGEVHYETRATFSTDGRSWPPPRRIGFPHQWLWRISWHDGMAYGISREFVANAAGKPTQIGHAVVSEDGVTFRKLETPSIPGASETALNFSPDGTLTALVRRVGHASSRSALGISRPPYSAWKWQDVAAFVGGPRLVEIDGLGLLAGGRHYPRNYSDLRVEGDAYMALAWTDGLSYHPFLRLPSGGDTSYPGFVVFEDCLWVSYYSSHEGSTAIYLARVPLDTLRSPNSSSLTELVTGP